MKYEEFKIELKKQISLNSKYFKPKEVQILYDFAETIVKTDFEVEQ